MSVTGRSGAAGVVPYTPSVFLGWNCQSARHEGNPEACQQAVSHWDPLMIRSTFHVRAVQIRQQRGFSLTELLVVIGIIVLLVGILLVALGKVQGKAKRTQTEALMNQFLNACSAFQAENGRYPGVIPEAVLATDSQITSTENAILDLLGGFRVLSPTDPRTSGSPAFDDYQSFQNAASSAGSLIGPFNWPVAGSPGWDLVVDSRRIGEGPMIDRKPRSPYYTPGPTDLAKASYPNGTSPPADIPDLIDAWGQPILYLRQLRERGPLTPDGGSIAPQFVGDALNPYVRSTQLGELASDQMNRSILNTAPNPNGTLAKILAHAAIDNQARGGLCLISAGPDGVYFSRTDGPGSEGTPVDDIVSPGPNSNPKVVDSYDDVRVFGGA
jgi:prepilin-type N-terminal cleavage/methylation domain-containing protein